MLSYGNNFLDRRELFGGAGGMLGWGMSGRGRMLGDNYSFEFVGTMRILNNNDFIIRTYRKYFDSTTITIITVHDWLLIPNIQKLL